MSPVAVALEIKGAFVIGALLCFLLIGIVPFDSFADEGHQREKSFENIYPSNDKRFLDFIRWRLSRIGKDDPAEKQYDFPMAENDPSFLRSNRNHTTLTWIGHSTLLLQLKGKNILTDPHLSERASPVGWAGPRRVTPPGLTMEDLPLIDAVIISHNHYDHLDKPTIEALVRREGGDKTIFFVPLRMKAWFEDLGISRVVELEWWASHPFEGLDVTAVPMHHWSKRNLLTHNDVLWAGWVVASDDFRFIFFGDCGYSPIYRDIGEKLGPFDLAAIPIGAYEPRWFMKDQHVNPEEALQVHLDLKSKKSVAIHWGTFVLTDEPLDEPPERLIEARKKENLNPGEFLILRHGETIISEK